MSLVFVMNTLALFYLPRNLVPPRLWPRTFPREPPRPRPRSLLLCFSRIPTPVDDPTEAIDPSRAFPPRFDVCPRTLPLPRPRPEELEATA